MLIGIGLAYAISAAASNGYQVDSSLALTGEQKYSFASYNHTIIKPNPPSEPRIVRVSQSTYCSCVTFAKAIVGYSGFFGPPGREGWARYWPTNSDFPVPGGVVVTSESQPGTFTGHVAIIREIRDNDLILEEANFSRCQVSSGRRLSLTSPLIIGYWAP